MPPDGGHRRSSVPPPHLPILQRRIRVARGQEPGDLVLTGGAVVDVFTGRITKANVVIADGWIAGVGPFSWQAHAECPVEGQFILPGLIDAHMHVESTLLVPTELARLVAPHGTTAVVADPHEVGNVLGIRGIDMLLAASEGLAVDFYFMAPSCVPATDWEDAGAALGPEEVRSLLARPRVLGLAEVMDFPALLRGDPGILSKVMAASAQHAAVDGHAPGLNGQDLVAYAAAGVRSDHESSTAEEAQAKAALGMLVQVREGSMAQNLDALLPLLVADQLGDWCLATDDIHAHELLRHGHIDKLLRRVVAGGVPLARAVRHATLVPARHYGLCDRGAIAPGHRADVVVIDEPGNFNVRWVVKDGTIVARDGELVAPAASHSLTHENTVYLARLDESAFELNLCDGPIPVIGLVPGQILTRFETQSIPPTAGCWTFDPTVDLILVASIERHRASGRIGLGLVRGFGLRRHGALGSSVAHDSHNLIIAGTCPRDMLVCARSLADCGGGFVVAADGAVTAQLPLPVAGLLSTDNAETVARRLHEVEQAALGLGCPLPSPFGTLSFLALPVIPELRITDKGLFDVRRQQFVPVQ